MFNRWNSVITQGQETQPQGSSSTAFANTENQFTKSSVKSTTEPIQVQKTQQLNFNATTNMEHFCQTLQCFYEQYHFKHDRRQKLDPITEKGTARIASFGIQNDKKGIETDL